MIETFLIIIGIIVIFRLFFSRNKRKLPTKTYYPQKEKSNIDKLKLIQNTDFKTYPLMTKEEFKIYQFLQELLSSQYKSKKYRLFTQVAMGGFITTFKEFDSCSKEEKQAFWAINHLRVDFLIINKMGNPILVIEYQGSGHYQNGNKTEKIMERDTRKRSVCQKVGISFVEIFSELTEHNKYQISTILDNNQKTE